MKRPSATRVKATDVTDSDLARRRIRSQVAAPPPGEDADLEQPVPNGDRIVAAAVVLAASRDADPELVARYWRLVPDEELASCTVEAMVAATEAHRALAEPRLPGEMKLRHGES